MCAWVRVTGFYTGPCGGNSILMKGNDDFVTGNYGLRFSDVSNGCGTPNLNNESFYGFGWNSANPQGGAIALTPFIQLSQWYSVVYTYDGIKQKIYVNCILRDSSFINLSTFTLPDDLFIGRLNRPDYPFWFNGDADEIRIYNRALTQVEVNQYGGCSVTCPSDSSFNYNKCSNQNLNLNARAGNTYLWSPTTGLSSSTVQSPVCSVTTNTNYIVTITNTVNNCSYRDTIKVNINNPASITTQPTPVTVCNGDTAKFMSTAAGTGLNYQWQSGPTASGPFTNVITGTGANTGTYSTIPTTPTMNGTYYQMLVTTSICPAVVATTPVRLTVNTLANIIAQPTAQAVCTPQPATFSVTANGTGLTYQWQISSIANPSFTNIIGAINASYTTPSSTFAMNGNQYRVNILSTCSPIIPLISGAALLTINNPSIAQQPTLQSGCAGNNYTFNVTTTAASPLLTYQWQLSPNGLSGTFSNISGANGVSYTITNAPLFLNGYFYRVYISIPCGAGNATDTSNAAQLLLSNGPSIVLTAPYTSNHNPAVNSGIFITVSPAGNYKYIWKRNGAIMPNTSTSTFILLAVDDEASYQVTITDTITRCNTFSNIIKTNASTSDNLLLNELFVYPNPANSRVFIRFNNSNLTSRNTMINIYDAKGALLYSKEYKISGTYGNMEIDISTLPPETYVVYLMDASGNKLAGGKILKMK